MWSTLSVQDSILIRFDRGPLTDIRGFVAVDPVEKAIIVSFRASSSTENWITKYEPPSIFHCTETKLTRFSFIFTFVPCSLVDGCLVHTGFKVAWDEIRDEVFEAVASAKQQNPDFKIVVTGHSLGGALATLASGYLRKANYALDMFTYGAPRVGNQAFASFITSQKGREYRITHLDDIVPKLPPMILGYRHTSPEYWLYTGEDTTVDYGVEDIKVCEGTASLKCNGGTLGFGDDAHGYYFQKMGGCDGPPALASKMKLASAQQGLSFVERLKEAGLDPNVQ